MDGTADTKSCPFCAEQIKAAAKKCPHCNSRQSRYALFRQEIALAICCAGVFGCFIFVSVGMWPGLDGSGRSFARHRADLEAKNVQANIVSRGTNNFSYDVSGVITNKGEYPWRVEELELTVINAEHITDVVHTKVKDSFVVQPHAEHAFILHRGTVLTNTIVGVQARVENAQDGNVHLNGTE